MRTAPNYHWKTLISTISFILLGAQLLNAQAYFSPPNKSWSTGNGPTSIITADFNGDGKKDLATANANSNNVTVLLGTGTGNFGVPLNLAAGNAPYAVVSADFNGDSKLDLASCNASSNNVSVFLGNGNGTFGAAVNFNVGTGPRGITTGDFNGDLNIDIATANYNSANVSILLGTGTGTFGAAANFAAGTGPRSILSAMFNGDAIADLAVSNETSNNVSILIGSGTGSFAAPVNFAAGTNPRSITCADFNGDAKFDLATANASNNLSVLIGTGTGSFNASVNYPTGITSYSIANADFNSDGKIDLAVANWGSDNFTNISVLIGTGTGTFGAALPFPSTIWTVNSNPSSLVCGDFNSDLKPDIAVVNYSYNTLSLLKSFTPVVGTCPAPMKIVILGASSSFGFTVNDFDSAYAYRFRQYIIDSINGYSQVINLAHAGYTTYAMQPNGYPVPNPYVVDTLRNITKAISYNPDAVIFNFTTNDVNALINKDTTRNNFLRATNMLDALGIPYWVTTSQPRNFTGDTPANIILKKQLLLDLRDTIIALYPQNFIESYVGFADINGDLLIQFDSGDNTHFNEAGHRKLFNNVKAVNIPGVLCSSLTIVTDITENNIKVFPNPSSDQVHFEFEGSDNQNLTFRLFDPLGKTLRSINGISGDHFDLDRSDLSSGIYFFEISTTKKLIGKGKIVLLDK